MNSDPGFIAKSPEWAAAEEVYRLRIIRNWLMEERENLPENSLPLDVWQLLRRVERQIRQAATGEPESE